MDAVAMRLLEIGEAVKGLSPALTETEPDVDWRGIAGMRDFLTHHYFATRPNIIQLTLDKRLPLLEQAIKRLQDLRTVAPRGTGNGERTRRPPEPCLRRSARAGHSLLRHRETP